MEGPSIIFPNLGITIDSLSNGFYLFGGKFFIAYYGVVIALGMILAVIIACLRAKATNQDTDDYIDVAIFSVIAAIICARLYYVLFSLDEFDSFADVINIRNGGLAIYGGVIGGCIAAFIVAKVKKISFLRILDTCAPTIILAQAIGRWGNFFNMEAYGEYTDSFFKMLIKKSEAGGVISETIMNNLVTVDGVQYIQVHPTFLYESAWCLLVFILIMVFSKFQQYNGEIVLWYIGGYAIERAFVEGLRTDQLQIGNSGIAVSQLLSVALVAGALVILVINRIRIASGKWVPDFHKVLVDGEPGTLVYNRAKKEGKKVDARSAWEFVETENEGRSDNVDMQSVAEAESDAIDEEIKEALEEDADFEITTETEDALETTEVIENAEEIIGDDHEAEE